MSDVTAQAFREASIELRERWRVTQRGGWHLEVVALLLAAAEQREQLDAARDERPDGQPGQCRTCGHQSQNENERARNVTKLVELLSKTEAERNELKAKFDRCFDSHEARLKERDTARAEVLALWDYIVNGNGDIHNLSSARFIPQDEPPQREVEWTNALTAVVVQLNRTLTQQIATLTAERDEARAKLYEHTVTSVTAGVTSVTAGANPQKGGGMSAPLFHVNCELCGERWSLQTWKREDADKLHPIGKCINAARRESE